MEKQEIIAKIKQSKKYSGISLEVIGTEVESFIKKFPGYERAKDDFILKQIKERLHKIYGSFQTKKKSKVKKLMEQLRMTKDNKILREILSTNVSTRERLTDYGFIYSRIFDRAKEIDSILDLGCGLNPLSFPYMETEEEIRYYAYDLNEHDMDIIKDFFNIYRINGHAEAVDLRNISVIKKLPPADICFMFKLLDPLEKNQKGHKLAEEIVQIVAQKCRFIVISFATNTVSGRPMNFPQRGWIERMLTRIELRFEKFETGNELFYIVKAMED